MAKQVTVTLTLPNGKRKYFRGATKREAEKKRDAARKELDAGLDISNNLTVAEFAEVWLREYKKGTVRDVSYAGYESAVRNHIVPQLGRLRVKEVVPAHIQSLMRSMSHLAKGTQSRILTTTRSFFDSAVENNLILKNPCVKSIRPRGEEADEKRPLTSAQSDMLLEKARGTKLYLFVLLGLEAGLRRGELLGLQWSDINFDYGILSVDRSIAPTEEHTAGAVNLDLKTDAAHRKIPLPWYVVDELRAARARAKSVYVIPGKNGNFMTLPALSYQWGKLVEKLNFSVHPHLMRHTRITRWFEQGLDIKEVQYLAGHSNSRMTLDIYTHYQEEARLPATAEKIRAIM